MEDCDHSVQPDERIISAEEARLLVSCIEQKDEEIKRQAAIIAGYKKMASLRTAAILEILFSLPIIL